MNHRCSTILVLTASLAFVLLSHVAVLTPASSAASGSAPANAAAWELYEPVGEVVLPPGDANVPRAVEEKDGYVYLLAREGILYTYDISDLPLRQSFTAYNAPVHKLTVYSGDGVLRYENYLYAFGGNGIQTIDVREPNRPALLGSRSDLRIYNLVRHENYLIAAGRDRIAVCSIAEPSDPNLLSELNLGEEQLVWSAAVYGRTLYACNWTSDWQDSYTYTLSVIDFSNPAQLSVLNAISRDDAAYHLRVIGNRLLECTSDQVRLWDATTPANPVFLTSQVTGGRVAAQKGDHLITNGAVLRPSGNELQIVATFKPGDNQRDGSPYGSAANASFVFLAQSKRVLILNATMPQGKYGGGTGTAEDPYQIWTAAQMNAIGTEPNDWSKHFKLMADLDLSGFDGNNGRPTFNIIAPDIMPANLYYQGIAFTGVFDGGGHKLSHLTIQGASYLGLFAELAATAAVHDLGIEDVNVTGSGDCIAALAAEGRGSISRCYSTGVVKGTGAAQERAYAVGGLIASNFGEVTSCHSTATVTGGTYVGGLMGSNWGIVARCYSAGPVRGGGSVGGFVGENLSIMERCYSLGPVTGDSYVGGLVGENYQGQVNDCYGTGAVSGDWYVGGLVGKNGALTDAGKQAVITRCYSAGAVKGQSYVGGLVGSNAAAVTGSFWDHQISGQTTSSGGTAKSTAEMRTAGTFLSTGWDFVGETKNGKEDIWWILEGQNYPNLAWEQVLFDDFEDGKPGPLWMSYEPEPQQVRLHEVHGRLEVEAVAQDQDVDAIYAADGWRLDAAKPFALRVDFHFGKQGPGNGRVNVGLVPSLDPAQMQWAEFEAGYFDIGPIYLYEVRDGPWVEEQVTNRSAESGTLYMSYNPGTDELYFSSTGYGKPNAWRTVPGLLQGRWAGGPVYVILSGGSEGMDLSSGDAWLDNFTIDTGVVLGTEGNR